jgi:hypothetical protein
LLGGGIFCPILGVTGRYAGLFDSLQNVAGSFLESEGILVNQLVAVPPAIAAEASAEEASRATVAIVDNRASRVIPTINDDKTDLTQSDPQYYRQAKH